VKHRTSFVTHCAARVSSTLAVSHAPSLVAVVVTASISASWLAYLLAPASVTISDAGRATEVVLRAKPGINSVYALSVEGTGHVDGDAEISLMLNGAPYKPQQLSGVVSFSWVVIGQPGGHGSNTPKSAIAVPIKLRYRFGCCDS